MARIEIADFDVTDLTIDKLWSHGIVPDQLYAVLDSFWAVVRNRRSRSASHILLGTDDQGRCLAIPIVPTDDRLVWRPITAWYCKSSEATKLRQARSIMEEPGTYESVTQPLDDDERELMDEESWDWERPIAGSTVGTPGAVLRVRFSREEFRAIATLARDAGIGPVELLRRTMLERLASEVRR